MTTDIREFPSHDALSVASAAHIATRAREVLAERGEFVMALSGGHSPLLTWRYLASEDLEWERITIFQVDERVAPHGHPDRNLTGLLEGLGSRRPRVVAMPVEESDLDAAAADYAALLPERFDLLHLGLGPDGHTASLVEGDPVLEERGRLVAVTGVYQERRRMTLTLPALARTEETFWLVSGQGVRGALLQLLRADPAIPASRVESSRTLIWTDETGVLEEFENTASN
ncbi:MAG: 6-phosphogluconolactonase [Acidobacteria bacterium]|nr:6-phosphogluconolactonase [Acidobacteriota bacterium]